MDKQNRLEKELKNPFGKLKGNIGNKVLVNYVHYGSPNSDVRILRSVNDYSAGVVDASLRVMQKLSEGKTPEEAEKVIDDMGISGFMSGCMAQTVSYFHPRGEEFRKYWNKQYMNEEEAEACKGIVNPAVLLFH